MSTYKNLMTVCCVAALALGLAACGGGGSSTPQDQTQTMPDPAVAAAEAAIGAANMAAGMLDSESDDAAVTAAEGLITAAETAIAALPAGDQAAHTAMLAAAKDQAATQRARLTAQADADAAKKALDDEKKRLADEAAAAKAAAMMAMAKKLHAGLGVTAADAALAVTEPSVSGGKLTATVDPDGTGDITSTSVTLDASGAVAPAIAGWNGMDYSKTIETVAHHAVVYTNPGAPRRQRFEEKHAGIITDATGEIPQSSFGNFKITGGQFATGAGTKTHSLPAGSTADYLSVRGTFDGAPGVFRCARSATCTSSVATATGVSLSAGWYFIADDGAMTSTPDANYIMFGWWARDPGKTVGVDTFAVTVGAAALGGDINVLEGSATYVGGASGKAAVYSPLSENNVAGAFTASASLTAKFGSGTAAGMISGTLSNFSVDGEAVDWSVALKETAIADGASTFGGDAARTVWTIDGEAAAESGMWQGGLYERTLPTATPPGDGVPKTAAGTFSSNYGTIGRMVGAFGANKQ